uniref:NADH-ubiquinone oxidoreductase chain 6 n=1 Tax=Ochthebius himalayae TaxID=1309160 RepID=A0A7H0DKF5_9COLE|nr:NADH dehydrogenase subunit 6 [Ochthebius himalayae]QNP09815.1 NADH dehydrogenase subunit 6 [Ochthebius himalayae]
MLMFMLFMNILLSINFMFMIHPLTMGMTLLMQTIMISLITGFMNYNYWFSYILFLIMIGGMLVLFIYMTSIASNEKFKFNNKLATFLLSMFIIMMMMYMYMDQYMMIMNNYNYTINMNYPDLMLNKFYNKPSNLIMFMMIVYLLITLIAVVKITSFKLGPLRQKF